jgi:hypothetical protein
MYAREDIGGVLDKSSDVALVQGGARRQNMSRKKEASIRPEQHHTIGPWPNEVH